MKPDTPKDAAPGVVAAVRASTDIVALVGGYTTLTRSDFNNPGDSGGSLYKGCCPFHAETTPSFCVDTANGTWHCFGGCGEGGDAIRFLQKAENLTFPVALARLAAKAGIPIDAPALEGKADSNEN